MAAIAFLRAYWRPLAVILLLISVWLHGHSVGAGNMDAKWQAIFAKQELQQAKALADYQAKARKQEQDAQARVSIAESIGYTALQEKQRENDRLRAAVESGRVRLRLNAKCPAQVPVSAQSAGVGDGAAPELTADARQAYFDLRAGIAHQQQQLTTCQDIVRAIVR